MFGSGKPVNCLSTVQHVPWDINVGRNLWIYATSMDLAAQSMDP